MTNSSFSFFESLIKQKAIYSLIAFVVYQFVSISLAYIFVNAAALNGVDSAESIRPDSTSLGISMLVCSVPLIFFLTSCRLIRRKPICPDIRLSPGTYFTTIIGFVVFSLGLSTLLSPLQLDDAGNTAMFANMTNNFFCIALLTVVGPLTEELVFREGIIPHFIEKKAHPLTAAFVSATLFALVHGNLSQGVPAFVFGFVFSLYFLRTGDIRLCLLLHIINNSLAVFLLKFPALEQGIASLPPAVQICIGSFGVLVGGFVTWKETVQRGLNKAHFFS